MVARLTAAGAVVIGKATTPEFGWKGTGISPRTGVTRNPWDPAKNSGGSSAGSAATVASGAVPVAIGTDGGGSIRIPASCCGLVGLKASRGRVLSDVTAWEGGAVSGVVSRDVADTAAVLDLTMPELNGLAAASRILASWPEARILILTVHESEQLVREVIAAGAQGYVLKSDAGRILMAALETLLEDGSFFTPKFGRLVLDGYLRNPSSGEESGAGGFSAREREIVQLLAEGKSNKEVATALGISVKTAETHRSNIMRKGGFSSLAELVRYAIRNRIIEP